MRAGYRQRVAFRRAKDGDSPSSSSGEDEDKSLTGLDAIDLHPLRAFATGYSRLVCRNPRGSHDRTEARKAARDFIQPAFQCSRRLVRRPLPAPASERAFRACVLLMARDAHQRHSSALGEIEAKIAVATRRRKLSTHAIAGRAIFKLAIECLPASIGFREGRTVRAACKDKTRREESGSFEVHTSSITGASASFPFEPSLGQMG